MQCFSNLLTEDADVSEPTLTTLKETGLEDNRMPSIVLRDLAQRLEDLSHVLGVVARHHAEELHRHRHRTIEARDLSGVGVGT